MSIDKIEYLKKNKYFSNDDKIIGNKEKLKLYLNLHKLKSRK